MTETILAAAMAATEEAVRAESSNRLRGGHVDPAEVQALVDTLPARAGEGKIGDASAIAFLFAEWDPRNHHAAEVAGAAKERLVALGLTPVVELVRVGLREVPGRLVIDYANLREAAQKEATSHARWLEAARALWVQAGGDGADVQLAVTSGGREVARFSTRALCVPVGDAMPFRMDFLLRTREREFEVEGYWLRDIGETVAFVESQIRPVRWTISALEAEWRALGGGPVTFSHGLYEGEALRQVTVVEFRRDLGSLKLAVEDVRGLLAEDLAERASLSPMWQTDQGSSSPEPLADRAPVHLVAGAAQAAFLGIDGRQRDTHVHVPVELPPPPVQAKGPEALTVPAGSGDIDPTRMSPMQAVNYAATRQRGSGGVAPAKAAAKKAASPKPAAAGRTRKAATAP